MFKLLQFAVVFLAGASTAVARPAYQRRQAHSNSSTTIITGSSLGGVQSRLEIHDLEKNSDQWNIYLLALQSFQSMDPSNPLSWYQISGIHGVPYVPYDNVDQCDGCPTIGYCTHSSTLFPVWHRAYVALFEQSLQANALDVANQFSGSDKSRYVAAATALRAPYWDWAATPPAGEDPFPQMFTTPSVSVNTPTGQQTIANPLAQYSFGSANHTFMATSFTADSDVTYRAPTFTVAEREQLKSDMYTTLTSNQGYNSFSTESLYTYKDNYNPFSLEMLHDRVHVSTGGDMAYIPTAAYDPVFWLHHGNIDHAFALWQAAYPDGWVEPWSEVGATFTTIQGTVEDSQSPLTPFRSDNAGDFWNPDALRNTTTLNYQYADLASGRSVSDIINSLYGSGATLSKRRASGTKQSYTTPQYIADIQADSMGTEGSFTVFFFDGDVDDDDHKSWHSSKSIVASHGFFSGPEKKGDGLGISNAGVSLSPALNKAVNAGRLASLDNDHVAAYLRKNLQWRVKMQNGTPVNSTDIPSFKVAIMTADVQIPTAKNELPVWGPFKDLSIG